MLRATTAATTNEGVMNNNFMDRVNAIMQQNQMSQNMMAAPQPQPSYPDAGIGALDNVVSGVPRQAELMNQPHMLAYINPQEEQMLRDAGGAGIAGPDGIPVYGWFSDTMSEITSGGRATTETYNRDAYNDRYTDPYEEMARNPQGYADPNYGNGRRIDRNALDGGELRALERRERAARTAVSDAAYTAPVRSEVSATPTTNYIGMSTLELLRQLNSPPQPRANAFAPTVRPQLRPEVLDTPTTNYQGNSIGGDDDNIVAASLSTQGSTAPPAPAVVTPPAPTVEEPIGALPSGTSGSGSGNSFRETLANTFTPFDGASYQNGRLVDDRTGEPLEANSTSSAGRTIRGTFNDTSNDENEVPQSFIDGLPSMVTNPNIGNYDPSQLDDKWGYTRPDGTVVTAAQDQMDGGGKNFGGEVFGISGGENVDLNGDGYITKAEAQAAGGLNENFVSSLSNASGATPLGSGLEPTGIAGVLNTPVIGGALTGGLSTLYTGARYLTDNFGYEGRAESSKNQSMEDTLSGLEGQNRINAELNADRALLDYAADTSNRRDGGGGGGGGTDYGDRDGDDRVNLGGPNAGPARSIYNRYYKGGGGRFLPPWLQRYASGVNIDELLTRQVIDGVEYYITPEGRQIEAQYLTGAAVGAEQDI